MTRATVAAVVLSLMASLTEGAAPPVKTTEGSIDFAGFLEVSNQVRAVRPARLLPLEEFLALAAEPGTLLLDTRSASAYAAKHLAGAVHLNLSDVTQESLRRVVGLRDRTILIYCNNNFTDDVEPFLKKASPAALNIPTFVTLWAYGYRNVWELGELVEQSDPRLAFEGGMVEAPGGAGVR